jgi:transcriptional regulator with XRE-family HTH domain
MTDGLVASQLATRLRRVRLERGLTLRQAAQQTGVTKETLSDLERARRQPHPPTLQKIAEGYNVEIRDLLGPIVDEEPALAGKGEAPEAGPAITRDSLMSSPESEKERREDLREFRGFLLEVHALLEEIVEKYKAAGDNDKLTTLLNVLIFNAWGAEQFVKEEIGLPEDRETARVYNAGAHLQDLIDDLREDLQEGQVVGPAEEPKDDLFMKRLLRKQAG